MEIYGDLQVVAGVSRLSFKYNGEFLEGYTQGSYMVCLKAREWMDHMDDGINKESETDGHTAAKAVSIIPGKRVNHLN